MIAQAISPVLWARHKPDRFDTWSAGITLLCLALPSLRTPRGLGQFLKEFERANYDLDEWRARTRLATARDLAPLDADDGAGWALAEALLRPRSIEVGEGGSVSFIGSNGAPQRLSASEALKHRRAPPSASFLGGAGRGLRARRGAWASRRPLGTVGQAGGLARSVGGADRLLTRAVPTVQQTGT